MPEKYPQPDFVRYPSRKNPFTASLRWWLTITEIIETLPDYLQTLIRARLQGKSLPDCQKLLKKAGHPRMTQSLLEARYKRALEYLEERTTLPRTEDLPD